MQRLGLHHHAMAISVSIVPLRLLGPAEALVNSSTHHEGYLGT